MSTLSQVGRGTVLLTSMALVACYIDVYATGKFPWQHAAAETPATIPPPEFVNDAAVQTVPLNAEPTPSASPLFLSGTKTYTGQTMLPGTLTLSPSPTPEQKAPAFMGGSKTLMLSPRLPETATPAAMTAPSDKLQFMGGAKSQGPLVLPSATIANPAPRVQLPSQLPTQGQQGPYITPPPSANAPNSPPQFMGGAKSPGPLVLPSTVTPQPEPRVQLPTQAPPFAKPPANIPLQQTAPAKITRPPATLPNAPYSPAGSY